MRRAWLAALFACEPTPAPRIDIAPPVVTIRDEGAADNTRLTPQRPHDEGAPGNTPPPPALHPPIDPPIDPSIDPSIDPLLADRYPSLEFYPGLSASLQTSLARPDAPRDLLAGIADSLAAYRWPSALDWDRQGFIDLHGPHPGFVTRVSGALVRQPGDRHDLGCAGGFLEAVRLLLLPRLAIDELDRCTAPTCDPEHDYGRLALNNIAALLSPRQLPRGPGLLELGLRDVLDPLAAPGAMHLCTVSHTSSRHASARYYHHLLVVLGTAAGHDLEVFDTTGMRGVSLVVMSRAHFTRYMGVQLAASQEYRYLGRSARLTCLPVAPGA